MKPEIRIVDVGAMSLGIDEDYAALTRAMPCTIIGFEPLEAECRKLQALNRPGYVYLPYFIGDGSLQTFYETNTGMTSSLLEPNHALVAKFHMLGELMQVVRTHPAQTTRLDDIPETMGTDYLKIDVQGGELMVLQGAKERLETALVVHTEVEFAPLYKGQPLFADIDAFLRSHGFVLHRFTELFGRTFKPLLANNDPNAMLSQVLWADAIYVRDFMAFDTLSPASLLKLAAIVHENYRSVDLALTALSARDRQTGAGLAQRFLQHLTTGQPAVWDWSDDLPGRPA